MRKCHWTPSTEHCLTTLRMRWPFIEDKTALVLSMCLAYNFIQGRTLRGNSSDPYLPARLTELLDIDGAAEGDNKQGEALRWQAVITDHSIQHLQRDLVGWREGSCWPCPDSYPPAGNTSSFLPTLLWSVSHPSPMPKQPSSQPQEQVSIWEVLLPPSHCGSSHPKL